MRYSPWITTGVLAAGAVTGLLLPTIHPWQVQPAQYSVYTVQQPRCSAAEAGDLTTFRGKGIKPFRAVCGRDGSQFYWDALPGPATPVQPVCGPGSNAETVNCPNVTDWRSW